MLPKFLTKKITSVLLFFFLFSALFSKPIQAFYTPNSTYQFQFENAVYGMPEEMNLQSFVYETLKAVVGSVITTIFGCVTCGPGEGETGMIRTISTFIAFLYTSPPASGVQYLADLGGRIGIVQPTYAQEDQTGFGKMEAYRNIWKAFRNLTYVFFVLVLVIMGFAIMFRVKISPQTVISIQSALPKVVIALILITFSYAIVGLLIDFMFITANLALFTLIELTGLQRVVEAINPDYSLLITSDIQAFGVLFLAGLFPAISILIFFMILPAAAGSILGPIVPLLTFGSESVSKGIMVGIDLFILVILAIILLIAMIKVFWSLLKAYVMVVVNLIFAPFQILIGVLPGSNAIANWFRNLIANLAVFPAVLMMLLLSFYLVYYALEPIFDQVIDLITRKIGYIAFIEGIEGITIDYGNATVLCFISLGILLMTPRVADMIKAFFAGKPFEYGTAIGEAFGPARTGAAVGVSALGAQAIETYAEARRPARGYPAPGEKALQTALEEIAKRIQGR